MLLANAPSKIVLPFANAGGKNTIPVPSQIGITGGAASFTDGFPPLTRTPVASGGIPPSGLDMNGILYDVSAIVLWANAGAGYVWDSSFVTNANVNGYPAGARILRSDAKGYWLNLTDANTVSPEASATAAVAAGWVPDTTNGVAPITMTNANVTLTPLQYGFPIISITGTLTASVQLIFPAIAGDWKVINGTTGAYTITCKTSGGTGVAVTQGATQSIVGDGTNIYGVASTVQSAGGVVGDIRALAAKLTTAGTSLTFTADQILVAASLSGPTTLLSSYSQTLNISTTGAGGMDTGSAPVSGYVAIYAINGTSGTSILGVNATSSAAPTIYGGANMPTGYTNSVLIGVWPTNGSSQFKVGTQIGRAVYNPATSVLNSTTNQSSYTSLSISGAVPPNAKSVSGTFGTGDNISTSTTRTINIASDSNGTAALTTSIALTSSTGAGQITSFSNLPITTAQTIYYIATTSTGTVTYSISVSGYTF